VCVCVCVCGGDVSQAVGLQCAQQIYSQKKIVLTHSGSEVN